ncbi:hypothetical protein LCGC14_2111330 [marine sediment metagenome]|uniref:Uncharacterized protein n=1 Tax=marine sediment metagenome TaxID=412755 RepID=A0A0F9H3C3_9ZZZZ
MDKEYKSERMKEAERLIEELSHSQLETLSKALEKRLKERESNNGRN